MTLTGKRLVEHAKSKVGLPYFYGSKMTILTEAFMVQMHKAYPSIVTAKYMNKARDRKQVGKINVDCSGLISSYTNKLLGSSQLYSTAKKRLSTADYKNWADGVICWRSGHVGVFFKENGKYYVVEAKGIDYGVVISTFNKSKWTCGLTFDWMEYDYKENVSANATTKQKNPYKEPIAIIRYGSTMTSSVKWLQFELVEAGYKLAIDGEFGNNTLKALKQYQQSCKIEADGECGPITIKHLKAA